MRIIMGILIIVWLEIFWINRSLTIQQIIKIILAIIWYYSVKSNNQTSWTPAVPTTTTIIVVNFDNKCKQVT